MLTAAKRGEVRWAEWAEIDRSERVWTIPARRMKTNRQHRVPLCGPALEIFEEAVALGEGDGPLVFTHQGGKSLDAHQLRWMVRELGIAAALAHVVRNWVEAAYARSDLFERRRRLMDDWAGYLAGPSRGPQA